MKQHLPDRPNFEYLKNEAKALLKAARSEEAWALELFSALHPHLKHRSLESIKSGDLKLSDAQWVLARNYALPSWTKLKLRCEQAGEIIQLKQLLKSHDVDGVEAFLKQHSELIDTPLSRNWGPPLSHAANYGNVGMLQRIRDLGATDTAHAFGRACLQGHRECCEYLLKEDPGIDVKSEILGPCETVNPKGLEFILALLNWTLDEDTKKECVKMLISTYSRGPQGKYRCLALLEKAGVHYDDTSMLAFHRGRHDVLKSHLKRDPRLTHRRWKEGEIYPLKLGIKPGDGLHAVPVDGVTFLHLAIEYDDLDLAQWLLDQGADVNARAAGGEGGADANTHSPLFHSVVSMGRKDAQKAKLLLDAGADIQMKAHLRKEMRYMGDPDKEGLFLYKDVTAYEFPEQYVLSDWTCRDAVALIRERAKT